MKLVTFDYIEFFLFIIMLILGFFLFGAMYQKIYGDECPQGYTCEKIQAEELKANCYQNF